MSNLNLVDDLDSVETTLNWIATLACEANKCLERGSKTQATNLINIAHYLADDFASFLNDRKRDIEQALQGGEA